MRGRPRAISTVLADALCGRRDAEPAALAAAFAEACGWPLAREVSLRELRRDAYLVAVASSQAWADQVLLLSPRILARLNARLGRCVALGLEVRVGSILR
ncbi:MAG TPA: DciA family protein [Anaeromyxobacteraceae bacterium]|nr:DciA family protein [Anaeromyxobacteraceae bacterium]